MGGGGKKSNEEDRSKRVLRKGARVGKSPECQQGERGGGEWGVAARLTWKEKP